MNNYDIYKQAKYIAENSYNPQTFPYVAELLHDAFMRTGRPQGSLAIAKANEVAMEEWIKQGRALASMAVTQGGGRISKKAFAPSGGTPQGSFATGTSSVPRTGNYRLHEGEMVLPESLSELVRAGRMSVADAANWMAAVERERTAEERDKEIEDRWKREEFVRANNFNPEIAGMLGIDLNRMLRPGATLDFTGGGGDTVTGMGTLAKDIPPATEGGYGPGAPAGQTLLWAKGKPDAAAMPTVQPPIPTPETNGMFGQQKAWEGSTPPPPKIPNAALMGMAKEGFITPQQFELMYKENNPEMKPVTVWSVDGGQRIKWVPKGQDYIPKKGEALDKAGFQQLDEYKYSPRVMSYMEKIGNYKMDWPSGFAIGRPDSPWQAAIEVALEMNPGFDKKVYEEIAKTRQDFLRGPEAKKITDINSAVVHFGKLWDAAHSMDLSRYPLVNKGANVVRQGLGSEELQAFKDLAEASESKMANIEKAKGRKFTPINPDKMGSKQIDTSIKEQVGVIMDDFKEKINQYIRGTHDIPYMQKFLSPEAKAALEKMGINNPEPEKDLAGQEAVTKKVHGFIRRKWEDLAKKGYRFGGVNYTPEGKVLDFRLPDLEGDEDIAQTSTTDETGWNSLGQFKYRRR